MFFVAEMSSLVERLRVRSDRRPIYTLDESDDEGDFVKKRPGVGPSSDDFERFQRPDVVILPIHCRNLMSFHVIYARLYAPFSRFPLYMHLFAALFLSLLHSLPLCICIHACMYLLVHLSSSFLYMFRSLLLS